MYDKEKIKQIVEELIDGTEQGFINWSESSYSANKDKEYKLYYVSDDGSTRFEHSIDLNNDLTINKTWSRFLYIRNEDLIDNLLQVSAHEYPRVDDLMLLLYDTYIKPTIAIKGAKKGVLDSILNGINKQHRRDKKIEDVLSEEEEKPKLNTQTYRKKRRGKWGLF